MSTRSQPQAATSIASGRGGRHTEIIRGLFSELEKALEILALLPGAGTPYTQSGMPDLQRLYIRKLGCHLYYTFDADDVIIRALWGARRERGRIL